VIRDFVFVDHGLGIADFKEFFVGGGRGRRKDQREMVV